MGVGGKGEDPFEQQWLGQSSTFSGCGVPSSISVKGEKAVAEHSVRQQPRSARMSCVASGVREGLEHH